VTVGADRFRLDGLLRDRSYLVGDVTFLPDEVGDPAEAAVLAPAVSAALAAYLAALRSAGAADLDVPDLPADPLVLSHLVAATVSLDLDERQALLAQPDGRARLRAELRLLKREAVLLALLRAVPSPLLTRAPVSPN
jgi:Lon protease-like protein